MTPEKKKELLEGFGVSAQNLNKIVEGTLSVFFGDGNSQDASRIEILAALEFGSYHMERDLEALERLLKEPGRDEYMVTLVADIVGAYLQSYDPESCRAWVREKTAMIREIYEQAVRERGPHF
jgi:hypothetical protein